MNTNQSPSLSSQKGSSEIILCAILLAGCFAAISADAQVHFSCDEVIPNEEYTCSLHPSEEISQFIFSADFPLEGPLEIILVDGGSIIVPIFSCANIAENVNVGDGAVRVNYTTVDGQNFNDDYVTDCYRDPTPGTSPLPCESTFGTNLCG
ncbi:MAG: hypothetical protein PF630_07505 [Gammaproteobacteria bacterium]|jgi:hypothetical protein|nr:hypothetical protein [Gammaproteobacteria bacterium]